MRPSVTVIVPVYNAAESLELLVDDIASTMEEEASQFELILVDDDSADRSWEIIQELAAERDWVRGVHLMRNYGQHNAILCAVRLARHEVIVTLDDDLQHPPKEIPKLLAKLDEGYDVVYGAAESRSQSIVRSVLARVIKRGMARAMGIRTVRDLSAFRAFRTELRKAFADYRSPELLLDALLAWGTTRFAAVRVEHAPRAYGRSGYGFLRLVNQTAYMLTGFTTTPLRLTSLLGFGLTLFGAGVLVYVVGRYLVEGSLPGFPFLASLISIFGGTQLFALGIVGEYLARMFSRTMERPTYTVAATTFPQSGSGRAAGELPGEAAAGGTRSLSPLRQDAPGQS